MSALTPKPVRETQRTEVANALERCSQIQIHDLPVTFSSRNATVTLPAVLVKFVTLSVLLRLDKPNKWQAALEEDWIPSPLFEWLGERTLGDLSEAIEVNPIPPNLFVQVLAERVGVVLIEMRQPHASAFIQQTIRRLLFHKGSVRDNGFVMGARYWKRFLRDREKSLRRRLREEVHERIAFAMGQLELTELAPRHWRPMPELSAENRAILDAAKRGEPHEKLEALKEAFEAGLFDFIADLLASTYSAHGRRGYHPVLMWKVVLAMMAMGEMEPGKFLDRVDDSDRLRLFLEVMSQEELPSARRIKGFLVERLASVAEYVVLWFNVELVTKGGLEMGDEFGTDGIEMQAQARTKSDAVGRHLKPVLEWLWSEIGEYLAGEGREELTAAEHEALLDALREVDWSSLGSARGSKGVILEAVRNALRGEVVTPESSGPRGKSEGRAGPVSATFRAVVTRVAQEFGERVKAIPGKDKFKKFNWDTFHDPECGALTKYGKTLYGFGMEFVIDLAYGLVWAFAVFPAGESFQPYITDFMLEFQSLHDLGEVKLTSDREFTIAYAMHKWHKERILHYGPRPSCRAKSMGIFTDADFEIHKHYAVCPNGKVLERKPKMNVRGLNHEWRYKAKKTDCDDCPLRAQCTTGKGPRMLGVNVYRDDMARHQARMEEAPEVTRDLMARHRSLVEGTVNNLKNHQGTKHALWKGLAMARLQFALAIVMLNLLKWHKVRHGELENLKEKRAREAAQA